MRPSSSLTSASADKETAVGRGGNTTFGGPVGGFVSSSLVWEKSGGAGIARGGCRRVLDTASGARTGRRTTTLLSEDRFSTSEPMQAGSRPLSASSCGSWGAREAWCSHTRSVLESSSFGNKRPLRALLSYLSHKLVHE